MSLSRDDLRAMAVAKVSDATHLFEAGRYSNAYYLFGYGVELALKARIARTFNAETIPDRRLVNSIYTYDLSQLVPVGPRPAGKFDSIGISRFCRELGHRSRLVGGRSVRTYRSVSSNGHAKCYAQYE